jgi:hypothetical protein
MLARLKDKASAKDLKPCVWKSTVQEWRSDFRYKLIFIPSGSFGRLTESLDSIEALKNLRAHLGNHGILLVEVETMHAVPPYPLGVCHTSTYQCADGKTIEGSQWPDLHGDVYTVRRKYQLREGAAELKQETEHVKIKLYQLKEMRDLLSQVGFSKGHAIKAFNRNTFPGTNDSAIIYIPNPNGKVDF